MAAETEAQQRLREIHKLSDVERAFRKAVTE